jgi:hypothetical protein
VSSSRRETAGDGRTFRSRSRRRAKRGASGRRGETGAEMIREIVLMRRRRRGSPRARETSRRGRSERVGRKKEAILTRRHGLNAWGRRKLLRTAGSRCGPPVCSNILSWQFHAEGVGEKWVPDVMCLRLQTFLTGKSSAGH